MTSTATNIHEQGFVFPGETFGNVHRFPTIEATCAKTKMDGTRNTMYWTIYCGILKEKTNSNLISANLNGLDDDAIISGFAAFSEPIMSSYFNHNIIDRVGYTVVDSRQVKADGVSKSRFSVMSFVLKGKNLTKANKTNAFTQAMYDAYSKFNKKKTTDYCEPMLAEGSAFPLEETTEKLTELISMHKNNYSIQYKYDGVRMLAKLNDGKLTTYSRNGKIINTHPRLAGELTATLMRIQNSVICNIPNSLEKTTVYLDGELYQHGKPLSEISGDARGSEDNNLQYWVYDMFFTHNGEITGRMAHNRTRLLVRVESQIPSEFIKYAPTLYVSKSDISLAVEVEEVESVYRKALADGYEGLIMRLDTPYNNTNRKSMYKLKELITEEFRVIGFTEGTGKMEKTIMYTCELTSKSKQAAMEYLQARGRTWESSDTKFNVTPMGSLDERRDMFKLMHRYEDDGRKHFDVHYRNRLYTVQFNNWSKFLKPMCPIGVGFREF